MSSCLLCWTFFEISQSVKNAFLGVFQYIWIDLSAVVGVEWACFVVLVRSCPLGQTKAEKYVSVIYKTELVPQFYRPLSLPQFNEVAGRFPVTSVCPQGGWGVPMWPLPMMHWTSLYRPLLAPIFRQTDETDNITFPQLRWRAVINYQYFMFKKNNVQEWDTCAILFKVILTNFIIGNCLKCWTFQILPNWAVYHIGKRWRSDCNRINCAGLDCSPVHVMIELQMSMHSMPTVDNRSVQLGALTTWSDQA